MQNGTDPGLVMTDTYGNDTVLQTVKLPDGRERLQVDVVSGGGSGAATVDVSALATEATLLALKNAVLTQTEIASTLWTDDSGAFYVRRDTLNEQTGAVVVGWFTPQGATSPGPGTGIRPASGSKDYEITSTLYTATAGGTGYSNGDTLIHALVLEVSGAAPVVAASIWLNVTTGLLLGAAPSGGNVTVNAPLPTGASTAARQDAMKTTLDSILTALGSQATATKQDLSKTVLDNILTKLSADPATATLQGTANTALAAIQTALGSQATATLQGTANTLLGQIKTAIEAQGGGGGGGSVPTGTAGTPNAAVMSVQGIAGGTKVKVAPRVYNVITQRPVSFSAAPITVQPGCFLTSELHVGGGLIWDDETGQSVKMKHGRIAILGNHTSNIIVFFRNRWDGGAVGVGDVTLNPGDPMTAIGDTHVTDTAHAVVLEPIGRMGAYTVYAFETEFHWFTYTFNGGQGHAGFLIAAQDAAMTIPDAYYSGSSILLTFSFEADCTA